jgi:site-specific recombinase XerD
MTALTPGNVYEQVVLRYLRKLCIFGENMGPHVMRATAATNPLDNGADIAKVQEWLGHANIATTRSTIAARQLKDDPFYIPYKLAKLSDQIKTKEKKM